MSEEEQITIAFNELLNEGCNIDKSYFITEQKYRENYNQEVERHRKNMEQVNELIFNDETVYTPTIVNEKSNFVVVTYWWGDENKNKNYARPCPQFYEDIMNFPMTMIKELWPLLSKIPENELKDNWKPSAPVEAVPVEAAPVEAVPVEAAPVEAAPVEATTVAQPGEAPHEGGGGFLSKIKTIVSQPTYPKQPESPYLNEADELTSQINNYAQEDSENYMSNLCYIIMKNKKFAELLRKEIVKGYISERRSILGKEKTPELSKFYTIMSKLIQKIIENNIDIYINIIKIKKSKEKYQRLIYEKINYENQIKHTKTKIESIERYVNKLNDTISLSTDERLKAQMQKDIAEYTNEKLKLTREKEEVEIKITKLSDQGIQNSINRLKLRALNKYDEFLKQSLSNAFKKQGNIVNEVLGNKLFLKFSDAEKKECENLRIALEKLLQVKEPITYKEMIAQWEQKLKEAKCNYLAIEYVRRNSGESLDDYRKRLSSMYQLLINAKPNFIKKALEICAPRNILYIDGDMIIKSYPELFDMPDYDYMARGWNIDPRGNEKIVTSDEYSIAPYKFETSGGIMYFGQTKGSKCLVDLWITETEKPEMRGKADDRIISLLFNRNGLLAPLKIFQLPIEYLYLDLWYNDFLTEDDYLGKVYVSHPQCLTSEETAASSGGAASSRQPPGYKRILGVDYYTSEPLYESILFDESKYSNTVRAWLNTMKQLKYYKEILNIDDFLRLSGKSLFDVSEWGTYGKQTKTYQKNMQAFEYKITNALLDGQLESKPLTYEKLEVVDQMRIIPKIAHQIWFGNKEIPEYKKAMMKTVENAAKCAGWTYKVWTQADFTEKNFPNVWNYCQLAIKAGKKYNQSRWAQVVDLCRYELLCRFGGAYLDTNFFASVKLFNAIDELNARYKQIVVCNEDPCKLSCEGKAGKYLSNSFICSVRHHPVFQHLISEEKLDSINFDRSKTFEEIEKSFYLNETTGPYYLHSGFDILDDDFSEIAILEPHQIYPIPMSKSELRPDVPNVCIAPVSDERVTNGTVKYVTVDESRVLLLNCWEKAYPDSYAAYMVGLGGSWDYSKALEEQKQLWEQTHPSIQLTPEQVQEVEAAASAATAASAAEVSRDAEFPPIAEQVTESAA